MFDKTAPPHNGHANHGAYTVYRSRPLSSTRVSDRPVNTVYARAVGPHNSTGKSIGEKDSVRQRWVGWYILQYR